MPAFADSGSPAAIPGKFVVEYSLLNYKHHPASWDIFDGLVWPWTFDYEFPVFSRDGKWPKIHYGAHQTDVIIEKTESFLKAALTQKDKPFFLYTAPSGNLSFFLKRFALACENTDEICSPVGSK